VLKISILLINVPKTGWGSASIFVHFWTKVFRQDENFPTIFRQQKKLRRQLPPPVTGHDDVFTVVLNEKAIKNLALKSRLMTGKNDPKFCILGEKFFNSEIF